MPLIGLHGELERRHYFRYARCRLRVGLNDNRRDLFQDEKEGRWPLLYDIHDGMLTTREVTAGSAEEAWRCARKQGKGIVKALECLGGGLFGLFTQRDKRAEHSIIGVMCIPAAGVGQEEDPTTRQAGLRETQLEAVDVDHVGEQHTEDRDPQEGDRLRAVSPDLPF